ncbi:MAG: lamin tail domain-containing protein [Deltaproteobacteria bacterium]|nr:lamin tail domain-containing protein [Deltaproteobacteria bacterium]MDQ3300851.1 lamin tail domain-containing protein [Myxococcota bacterium]
MARWLLMVVVVAVMVAGCGGGAAPDLIGLVDQIAVVGHELVLELEGVDPDGDALTYSVKATDLELEGNATVTQTPGGRGVFRWTPVGTDVGMHAFDFTVSDGSNDTTVTITIDVRSSAGGLPIFREPLGAGRVINLATDPCIEVSIVVEDQDTAQLTIAEEDPAITGAMLDQLDGQTARWRWCPTPAQIAASNRYTLVLSADDAENPKAIKNYVIAFGGGASPGIVINEVDYDNVGTDSAEYLELFNPSAATTSLAGLKIVLVNGATNTAYSTIDLSSVGSLAAGKYLVIAGPGVSVPTSAQKLNPAWTQDQIQNGPPDGIALIDDVAHTLIDAFSYEGAITAATIAGFPAPVSLVEGTALDAAIADSNTVTLTLCRSPNGKDTNQAAADWKSCNTRTPGTANVP